MISRAIDLLASTAILLLTWPLLIAIAIVVKLSSAGPVVYRGTRVGLHGVPFEILKFRTMRQTASEGPQITRAGDPRITPVGRFLRRYKLDELPQLWNVLRGDMSLVGPRPEHPKYVALYTPAQRRILDVRPGVTSPASIDYSAEETLLDGDDWERHYIDVLMPAKLQTDLAYLERRGIVSDLQVLLRTAMSILTR